MPATPVPVLSGPIPCSCLSSLLPTDTLCRDRQMPFLLETIYENNGFIWGLGRTNHRTVHKKECCVYCPHMNASRSQPCKVPFVLLQPLVQCLGFGVESQGQINVPVRFQGIETEHVGQVLSPLETKLLVFLRSCLETENPPCLFPLQPW